MIPSSVPAGWLTVVAVTAVVTVNAAGIWGIAGARRDVRDETARLFRAQTESRARAIESGLGSTRTDLAFLAGSSVVLRLGSGRLGGAALDREWSRPAAEGALLVFLRGHPEVRRLAIMVGKGEALVEAGRRGGVPVLWRTSDAAAHTATEPEPGEEPRGIRAVFAHSMESDDTASPRLAAEIDAHALLASGGQLAEGLNCALSDSTGRRLGPPLGSTSGGLRSPGADRDALSADAPLRAEGWSASSPWLLSCVQRGGLNASLEPVAARGRAALLLNLAVMALTLALGFFAVQQARRRERLEARAREEQRVLELERQLFHAERLGTMGRLAAGLAHELNNPLEGMTNYVALAREHLAAGDLEAARDDLGLVRQGLDRAAGIVRQVLAQANRAETPLEPVDLGAVLRQSVDFVRSRPEFRDLKFRVELPEASLTVDGWPVMLGQVFLNLLRNACEAQGTGGDVEVTASRDGSGVKVEIADRGPGVPAADRRRIFEPFYSTKSSTGLGLSVCDAILRQHQGRIEVQERAGGGAVFALFLPAGRAEARSA